MTGSILVHMTGLVYTNWKGYCFQWQRTAHLFWRKKHIFKWNKNKK